MDVTEYEYDCPARAQLLDLRSRYIVLRADAFAALDWEKMKVYDRLVKDIEEELSTL